MLAAITLFGTDTVIFLFPMYFLLSEKSAVPDTMVHTGAMKSISAKVTWLGKASAPAPATASVHNANPAPLIMPHPIFVSVSRRLIVGQPERRRKASGRPSIGRIGGRCHRGRLPGIEPRRF